MLNTVISLINQLFQFWIESHWSIALLISTAVNIAVYLCTAWLLSIAIRKIAIERKYGKYIDNSTLKDNQIRTESKHGIFACVIFALGSLASRELFSTLWPNSTIKLIFQVASFIVFYETYSYFIHRLLHSKFLVKYHSVHHQSVRVTPWSAYSVHPVEALFIGFSAPIFMLVFPLSLGVALALHVSGMMFTILLHSNFKYTAKNKILEILFSYPSYHSNHHAHGSVNYGFVNQWWDIAFKTNHSPQPETRY